MKSFCDYKDAAGNQHLLYYDSTFNEANCSIDGNVVSKDVYTWMLEFCKIENRRLLED